MANTSLVYLFSANKNVSSDSEFSRFLPRTSHFFSCKSLVEIHGMLLLPGNYAINLWKKDDKKLQSKHFVQYVLNNLRKFKSTSKIQEGTT